MKKILALLTLVILVLLVARQAASLPGVPTPPPPRLQVQVPQEGKSCSVPKAWGDIKGVADRAIAFVDSAGTIRVLDVGPCERGQAQLIVSISRQ